MSAGTSPACARPGSFRKRKRIAGSVLRARSRFQSRARRREPGPSPSGPLSFVRTNTSVTLLELTTPGRDSNTVSRGPAMEPSTTASAEPIAISRASSSVSHDGRTSRDAAAVDGIRSAMEAASTRAHTRARFSRELNRAVSDLDRPEPPGQLAAGDEVVVHGHRVPGVDDEDHADADIHGLLHLLARDVAQFGERAEQRWPRPRSALDARPAALGQAADEVPREPPAGDVDEAGKQPALEQRPQRRAIGAMRREEQVGHGVPAGAGQDGIPGEPARGDDPAGERV